MPMPSSHGLRASALALALVTSLLTSCGGGGDPGGATSAPTHEPRALTLQLDWYPNADHVGLYAALDRGLYRDRGLDVTFRPPSDVSDSIRLVAAGRADVGISYEPELVYAQQKHVPVVAVAALVPRALNSIIARRGEGITTPADLRGRTVGVDGSATTTAY